MEPSEWRWQTSAGTLVLGAGLATAFGTRSLHVGDLSLTGLVLDVMGAFYLGRGLIVEPRTNVDRAASRFGPSAPVMLGVAQDKTDGRLGVMWLVVGFSLQVVAYLLQLGDVGPGRSGGHAVAAATGLALVAGALVYLVSAVAGPRLLRRELRGIARIPDLHGTYGWTEAALLNEFAHLVTGTPGDGLYDPEFVERVFGPDVIHPELTDAERAALAARTT